MNNNNFNLDDCLSYVRKYLPIQGPIKNFVQQNILLSFMEYNFDHGIEKASQIYNSYSYMPLSFYRQKYKNQEISDENLKKAIKDEKVTLHDLNNFNEAEEIFKKRTFRDLINKQIKKNIDHHINPILFRLLSSYTDQGISLWNYLDKSRGFLISVRDLITKSTMPLVSFASNKTLNQHLINEPDKIILDILKLITKDEIYYEQYIFESLLVHPGWSGMVNSLEKSSKLLNQPVNIRLKEVLAFKLVLEYLFIEKYKKTTFCLNKLEPDFNKNNQVRNLQKIWHQAMELNYYEKVAKLLVFAPNKIESIIDTQVICCIDAREESFRRWLEHFSINIETFSMPGFFNIDSFLLDESSKQKEKICPLPLNPTHVIIRKNKPKKNKYLALTNYAAKYGSHNIFLDFIATHTLGHLSLLSMLASLVWPQKKWWQGPITKETFNNFDFIFDSNFPKYKEYQIGYTEDEMAFIVKKTLTSIGLRKDFAPLIIFMAHGSTSTNNPHFAGYNCGACCGQPGTINAIILAQMANNTQVRKLLEQQDLKIPDSTIFVAGSHNTCTDEVEFFDTKNLLPNHKNHISNFKKILHKVCMHNAKERCEKFALVPKDISPKDALLEVKKRSLSLFEPRPELGNATNALAIVARRQRSYGKNFNRRAFLQSYDPLTDPEGIILNEILSALIPVAGGINLAYYFSRLDPSIYGCGSKVSHNVSSLLGVGNGADDDLRTGLPIQMTELHDPIRLFLVIEQEKEIIKKIIQNNQAFHNWIFNDWMKLGCLSITENKLWIFCTKTKKFKTILEGELND